MTPLGSSTGAVMGDVVTALLQAHAAENAELREQLAVAQDMLMETAIDAGNLYQRLEVVQIECNAWRTEAERLRQRYTILPVQAHRIR